ncbi:hypothetical protein [Brevundimonas lenta]|uniref:Uncharacterized protein n=1 Tax=Brevundimonas lenta TaxID=424796 RepID=A0A7W6NPK6_9CAUL|nr:hypothetical protein [Brevundimonas lenta]MBB4082639.1 hypothetical protein [Brevundimonas lenta]
MPVVALVALSLIAAQDLPPPRQPTAPPAAGARAGGAPPPPPGGPQPQEHEIKAVTGNEGGQPHTGGTAQTPIPAPTVGFRPSAPPPPAPPAPEALTGRPVGQPAAAGLGSHGQREASSPTEAPAAPSSSPG